MDFLNNLGITSTENKVEELKATCFNVYERESKIVSPLTGELINDGFYTILNDRGDIHGKVSSKGSILPMQDLIGIAYAVDMEHNLNLDFNKAKLNYFSQNSVCTLRIPMETIKFVNDAGMVDELKPYLYIKNGFGGSSCIEIGVFTVRFVCSNGIEVRKGADFYKSKHTLRMNDMAKTFLGANLPKLIKSTVNYGEVCKAYDKKLITKADSEALKKLLFKYTDIEEVSTKKRNQIDEFNSALDIELSRCGNTAWGLLNAATYYTNHLHFNSSNDFIVTGQGSKINKVAEDFCYAI